MENNGKVYIGKKTGVFNNNYYGSGKVITKEIDKFGKECFELSLLEYAETENELNNKEIKHIHEHRSQDPSKGYNVADGGSYSENSYKGKLIGSSRGNVIHKNGKTYSDKEIYYTYDYSIFDKVSSNRDVSVTPKLRNSIEAFGVIQPIVVNEHFQVIDGQHRLAVLEELGYEVKFIVVFTDEYTEEVMIELNIVNGNWSKKDFIYHYAKKGKEDYIELQSLIDEYSKSPYHLSMGMIEYISSGNYELGYNNGSKDVKKGDFEIYTKKGIDFFIGLLTELIDDSGMRLSRREFVIPMRAISSYKGFDINHFIGNCRKENYETIKRSLYNTNRYESFGELLKLYNKRSPKKELEGELAFSIDKTPIVVPKKEALDKSIVKA